jgi:hypothetical protein
MTLLHSAQMAVLLACSVGATVALSSGDLRADRDPDAALVRANDRLTERLAEHEAQLAHALDELAALRTELAATKPTTSAPGTSAPGAKPKTAAEAAAEERAAFRAKALVALKPELDAIDARATKIESTAVTAKTTFDKHTHEVEFVGHGWVKLDVMLDSDHFDTVRKPYLDDFVAIRDATNSTFMKSTTKPK